MEQRLNFSLFGEQNRTACLMYVSRSDEKSHETVIFVKYFDSTFIVGILNFYNMIFKFTPKSSLERPRKPPLFRITF